MTTEVSNETKKALSRSFGYLEDAGMSKEQIRQTLVEVKGSGFAVDLPEALHLFLEYHKAKIREENYSFVRAFTGENTTHLLKPPHITSVAECAVRMYLDDQNFREACKNDIKDYKNHARQIGKKPAVGYYHR